LGRKWQQVAQFFEGRTDINVKNRWNHLRKHNLIGPVREPLDPLSQLLDGLWEEFHDHFDVQDFGF
jgi:hypothetical protein